MSVTITFCEGTPVYTSMQHPFQVCSQLQLEEENRLVDVVGKVFIEKRHIVRADFFAHTRI